MLCDDRSHNSQVFGEGRTGAVLKSGKTAVWSAHAAHHRVVTLPYRVHRAVWAWLHISLWDKDVDDSSADTLIGTVPFVL